MSRFDRAQMMSNNCSMVTMALACIVSHIEPDIDRKSLNLYIPTLFNAPVGISQICLVLGKLECDKLSCFDKSKK